MHKTLCVKGEYEADKDNLVLSLQECGVPFKNWEKWEETWNF